MIYFPTPLELEELMAFHEPFCLTMYVPLIPPNAATNPNRIELKNFFKNAERMLRSSGATPQHVKSTLRQARLLADNDEYWPVHYESLALFMHPKLFRYYHLPEHTVSALTKVQTGFDLVPLLDVMRSNQHYYVLALGHKNVRLFEGDHFNIKPVHLKNFPANMHEVLHIDEYPKSRETHTISPVSRGKGSEAYHEQYNVSQTDKNMLVEFFRWVDQHLHNFLAYHQEPLILAGVSYLLPMYRKINTYPGLVAKSITGNQDAVDLRALRTKAWNIVESKESKPVVHSVSG